VPPAYTPSSPSAFLYISLSLYPPSLSRFLLIAEPETESPIGIFTSQPERQQQQPEQLQSESDRMANFDDVSVQLGNLLQAREKKKDV